MAQDSIPPKPQAVFITRHPMNGTFSMPDSLKQGMFMTILDSNEYETTDTTRCAFYCITEYKDGKKNGTATYYRPPNLLVKEIRYDLGKLVCIRLYHDNEKLFVETFYGDGKKTGLERTYYRNGILHIETPYSNGLKYGYQKEYFEDGKLKIERPYINGLEEGIEKSYSETGELLEPTIMYERGSMLHKAQPAVRKKAVHHKVAHRKAVHHKGAAHAKKD